MIDWRHWHNEPYLVGGLILLGWLYALATGPFRSRLAPGAAYPAAEAKRFYASLVIFYLAVGSPLDQIGERFLLSAHMVQHQLLIFGSAVLMLRGTPVWLADFVLARSAPRAIFGVLFHPLCCGVIYTLTLTAWHHPRLYDWALQDKEVHVVEHLMFFGAAIFFWWPLLSPSQALPRRSNGVQMIYLVLMTIAMTPLFAFLAFSTNILYPTYEYAPRIIDSLTPYGDQLLGAAIMKLGSLAVTLIALAIAFQRWNRSSAAPERRT